MESLTLYILLSLVPSDEVELIEAIMEAEVFNVHTKTTTTSASSDISLHYYIK